MTSLLPALLLLAAAPAADLPADPVLRTFIEGEAAIADGDHASLLDTAQILDALGASPAEGQEDVAALWKQEAVAHGVTRSALGGRGRALGPAYLRDTLKPGASITLRQLFLAGQPARLSLAPARGAAGLSLRVQGADGTTLCARAVAGPQADCLWTPPVTDRYAIVVENDGTVPTAFYLLIR